MTKKLTHPDLLVRLPKSYGRRACAEYGAARKAVLAATDPEQIVEMAVKLALWVENDTPASQTVVSRLWEVIYDWNLARSGGSGEDVVRCLRCGEWRPDHMEGSGTVTRHTAIIGFRRTAALQGLPAVLNALLPLGVMPTDVQIEPTGCQHQSFAVTCRTCTATIPGTFVPYLKLDGNVVPAPPSGDDDKKTLN